MKTTKKFVSFIMAVVILFSGIATFPVTALDNESTVTTENDDLTVSGTNSTGNLIANALSDVQAEQEENNGYNVFSATVEDNAVLLEVETLEDCTVVVCIYDEAGTKLITSGYTPITTEDKTAIVVLETEEMPQYFYLRAFLVDSNTFRPISTSYECPNYTQEMQEFLAKTTEDFETDRVVNFDDSVDNNFAVYDESTIVIPEDSTGNDVASVDDETGVYVIENADESITSLVAGDIFAYEYEDGNILIVKVAEITIDGTTATIKGEETTLEEVFEYVKIDTSASTEDATVDTSTLEEGATYEGIVESVEDDDTSTYGVSGEGSFNKAFSFNFADAKIGSDNTYVQLTGGLEYKVKASVKVYISWSYQYLELKIDNSLKVSLSVAAKVEGKIPLATIGFAPVPGVYIEFTPAVVVRFSAKIEFSATISMTVGFRVSNEEGMKNITTSPKVTSTIKVEGAIYVGLSLEPKVKIIHDSIASVSVVASIGAEIRATMDALEVLNDSIKHSCADCIDGDIVGIIDLSFNVKLLKMKALTWKLTLVNETFKIADFYYSVDHNEFGFSTCPYLKYKVSVTVVDSYGNPVKGASVKNEYTTNSKGKVTFYLSNGLYSVTASKSGYKSITKFLLIKNEPKKLKYVLNETFDSSSKIAKNGAIALSKNRLPIDTKLFNITLKNPLHSAAIQSDGNLYTWGQTEYANASRFFSSMGFAELSSKPEKVLSNIVSVSVDCLTTAAVTSSGDLYTWGVCSSYLTNIEEGGTSEPTKVMSNVKYAEVCNGYIAVIKNDNSLYVQDFRSSYSVSTIKGFTKVMTDVVAVSVGDDGSFAAIKSDGSLYTWGGNDYGQLGNGTTNYTSKPKKIMSNVASVSLGNHHGAAITKDGSLYTWGLNDYGQLGNGSTNSSTKPQKIMSNISYVDLGHDHSAAISANGTLYMWGNNSDGQYGNGTTVSSLTPKLVMSNVKSVSLGYKHSAIIKADNNLYMCGEGEDGGMGSLASGNVLTPIKIMSDIKLPSSTYSYSNSINSFYADTVTESTDTETDTGTTEDTTTDTTPPTEKTVEYTGLLANEVYNFYVMKDRESELPFGADNLLYMTQAVSDADGNLSITYTPTAECNTADIFVKGMTLTDISTSHTISHDIVYNRAENLAVIDVLCNGEYLEEGLDYEITEGQVSKDIGTYTAIITGIGDYTGTLTTTYEVYCGHDYNTGKCIMCGHNKGDADANGEINIDDYNLMASAAALTTVIEDDVARCDMNGDGVVDGFDAIILDLRNNDMLRSTVTGDANGDGMVDDNDYTFLESVINGETATTDNVTRLCDLNNDGAITTDDLTMLESYLNGNLDWA